MKLKRILIKYVCASFVSNASGIGVFSDLNAFLINIVHHLPVCIFLFNLILACEYSHIFSSEIFLFSGILSFLW